MAIRFRQTHMNIRAYFPYSLQIIHTQNWMIGRATSEPVRSYLAVHPAQKMHENAACSQIYLDISPVHIHTACIRVIDHLLAQMGIQQVAPVDKQQNMRLETERVFPLWVKLRCKQISFA